MEIIDQVKYINVKSIKEEIKEDQINIVLCLNQKIDGKDIYKVNCEDKTICHRVSKILQEEVDKITEIIN